jgi:hypothetical protein
MSVLRNGLSIVFILSLLLAAVSIQAQDGTLRETFDAPDLPDWELGPGVEVIDGALHVPAPAFGFWRVIRGEIALSLRARLIGEGELVVGYYARDTSMYQLTLHPTFARLTREANGVSQELAAAATDMRLDDWVQIDITAAGGTHVITVNGQPLLTGNDSDPLPPGGIFLHIRGTAAGEFDDLVLAVSNAPAAPVAPAPVPNPAPVSTEALTWVRTGGPPGGLGYG